MIHQVNKEVMVIFGKVLMKFQKNINLYSQNLSWGDKYGVERLG
jgi:hypothetical protein